MPSLSIVIPAFNESARLPPTLRRIALYLAEAERFDPAEVIVVDDGSDDDTSAAARSETSTLADAGVALRISRNPRNRGKGFSVRRGLQESRYEWQLFSDADLSTPIDELDNLLRAAKTGNYDIAIGSRAMNRALIGKHQPIHREALGRLFNLNVRLLTGLRISDTQCGFKLFSRRAASEITARQLLDGFGFDVEQIYLARKLGFSIAEVGVVWNDSAASTVSLRSGLLAFTDILRIKWNDAVGRYD